VELLQPEPAVHVLDRREELDVFAALMALGLEHSEVALAVAVGGAGAARDDRATRSWGEDARVAAMRRPSTVTDTSVTPRVSMTLFIVGRKSGSAASRC
jgi:hypothetical protein